MFAKICGITNEDDALLSIALGATAVGFVFAPSSRQVAPQVAADIIKRLPIDEVITVGVFRDSSPEWVLDVAQTAGVHAVQLHGHEPPSVSRWLRARLPMVIQAFPAGDGRVRRIGEYFVDAVMLDAPSPGSGQVFDWSLAAEVPAGQRVIIAGGLDASNVASAISQTRPWGVDVSSGVEARPGYKDPIKLRDFLREARNAFEALVVDSGPDDVGWESQPPQRQGRERDDNRPYDWQEEF